MTFILEPTGKWGMQKTGGNVTFCYIGIFKIIKNKSEGHFPSGHKCVTN